MRNIVLVLTIFLTHTAFANTVVVGIKDSKPFVDVTALSDDTGKGISLELWEILADQQDIEYTYKQYQTIDDLIAATQSGEIDVAVAPISITSDRESVIDFTHSYYQSGIAALVSSDELPFYKMVLAIVPNLLGIVGAGLLIMLVLGLPFMFFEEKNNAAVSNDHMGKAWFDALYWVSTTITTVGYGDITPATKSGRVYAIIVMWIGLLFTGIFIAYSTTMLDVDAVPQINVIQDIKKPVGVLAGSYSDTYATTQGSKVRRYTNSYEAINDLRKNKIGAFIHDRPILEHLIKDEEGFRISQGTFTSDNYGFALPANSPHREAINKGMLGVVESSAWTTIVTSYK